MSQQNGPQIATPLLSESKFELNSNLDGNSTSSSSFSDDFMTAGSFCCDGISIQTMQLCQLVNNDDKDHKNSV